VFPVYPVLAVFSVTKADSVQLQFEIVFVAPASNQSSAYLFQSNSIVQLKEVRHGNDVLSCWQPWSRPASMLWCFQPLGWKSRKYLTL